MTERGKRRALVLGVGNILMMDEGLGVRAVELFRKKYGLPADVACVDGGTAGVALLMGFFMLITRRRIAPSVSNPKPQEAPVT